MTETIAAAGQKTSWHYWAYEVFFSLNLAWIVIWHERMSSSSRLYSLPIVRYLYRHTRLVEPETVIVQVCWSFIVGGVMFLLLRLFSRLWSTGALLRSVAGILALTGFPFLAVCLPFAFPYPTHVEAYTLWLVFETLVALLCGALYYFQKWPIPAGPTVALLFLHFTLWAWVTGTWISPLQEIRVYGLGGSGIWISTAFYFGFPVLGFLSSLTWAKVLRCDPNRAQAASTLAQ
jgi:hypothetical protein